MFINIILISLLLAAPACQPGKVRVEPLTTPTIALAGTDTTLTAEPDLTLNPLTGLPAQDVALLDRRPVMIKVSNYPQVGRPHAGLAYADIVFDYFIGSGTNRFLAVFYGQDAESIGPVRSGRLVDVQLVSLYQGILGFGGAEDNTREIIYRELGRRAIANLEAPCPAFCGTDTHSVTGVFANSGELSRWYSSQAKDNQRYDLGGMTFAEAIPASGQPAEKVTILFNYYNRGEWRFDNASGNYLRWTEFMLDETTYLMLPSTERATGEQLSFANIILLFAKYDEINPSKHDIELFDNSNGQRAVFFRDGQMFTGQWQTPDRTRPIQFTDASGNPFALKPGNTWIAILGQNSLFNQVAAGQWQVFFVLP